MTESEVKAELSRIRKLSSYVKMLIDTERRYKGYLERLSTGPDDDETKRKRREIMAVLDSLDTDKYVSEAIAMEMKYIKIINTLDNESRTIMLAAYWDGVPQWQIGVKLGYEHVTIRKKMVKIIRYIVDNV